MAPSTQLTQIVTEAQLEQGYIEAVFNGRQVKTKRFDYIVIRDNKDGTYVVFVPYTALNIDDYSMYIRELQRWAAGAINSTHDFAWKTAQLASDVARDMAERERES
jgi:hypothetical protein